MVKETAKEEVKEKNPECWVIDQCISIRATATATLLLEQYNS